MKRFAIDIVILPPDPVMDMAIAWNRKLARTHHQPISLSKTGRLPHVSLLMGCIAAEHLPEARTLLDNISARHDALKLLITGVKTVEGGTESVAAFDIALSAELTSLQRSIIEIFNPILTHDTREEDINDLPPISKSAIEWINHFLQNQSFENLWPHITLGHGKCDDHQKPHQFTATRLAMCHLGNHCTCTTILAEVLMKPIFR